MRGSRWAWLALGALLLAGCAQTAVSDPPAPAPRAVVLAVGDAAPPLAVEGVELVHTQSPLEAVAQGQADMALTTGAIPEGFTGFPLAADAAVVLQGWLDPPLSLTRTQAEERLRTAPEASAVPAPGPGLVARGGLADLKPGWRAAAVNGVLPTPETVWSGEYPLARRTLLVYPKSADSRVLAAVAKLKDRAPAPASWATLSVAGDFMLARGVARAMRENGTLYPVEQVKAHLAGADLAFANLESPIGVKGQPLPGKKIWFRAPPEAMEIVKAAGIDGVALANNHILDYDTESFLETLDGLTANGIAYVGGGRNITEARKPLVLEAKGVRIAFLAYSQFADLFFDWDYPRTFAATDTLPGVPRIQDDWLAEDIKAARAQADIVAVAYHWGDEFQNYPNEEQKRVAHLTVDLSADLVLGYHPHAIQGFELYKGKFIAYSTGNFIMDRQDTDLARESMILDFTVSQDGVKAVNVHPVWIRAEQPYIMTGAEGERLLQKMRVLSGWQ